MQIDLTAVFDLIIEQMVICWHFCQNVLVFRIGSYTFNMLNFSVGVWCFARAFAAIFGSSDEEEV